MSKNCRYNYNHYFDFSNNQYFSEMNEVFSGIFDRSVKYFLQNQDGYGREYGLRKIAEFVRDLEKSLVGLIDLGYVTKDNLKLVKDTYKSLDTIGLLDQRFYGRIYGITQQNRIEINPELNGSRTLTGEERTLLYVCHEIGHRFHFGWANQWQIRDFVLKNKQALEIHENIPQEIKNYIYSGPSLLDEALTQDRAENIAYYFAGKRRPLLSRCVSMLFDGNLFRTNFDYYGELQEIAMRFGKTLRGISNDEKKTLKELGRAAIDDKFLKKIENEYKKDNKTTNLYLLLHSMGIIKEASYAAFGMGTIDAMRMSKKAKDLIEKYAIPTSQSTMHNASNKTNKKV